MRSALLPFTRLGAQIEERWSVANYSRAAFSKIAATTLDERALHRGFDLSVLVHAMPRLASLPTQANMRNSFGDPPITVFSNDRFNIELLVWHAPATAIHDHGFSGAFTTLFGTTFQCRYTFEIDKNYKDLFLTGKRRLVHAELVRPGNVHEIEGGAKLIHAVWHLPCPSVSIVVRTHQESPNQYGYLSHCASNSFEERRMLETDALFNKRRALLASLCALEHADRTAYMRDLIARATPFTLFHFLEQYIRSSRRLGDGELRDVLRAARKRHPAWVPAIWKSLRGQGELGGRIQWDLVRTEGCRFLLALLLSVPEKRAIVKLIQEAYPGRDVEELVFDWTRELVASNATKLSPKSLALLVSLAPSRLDGGVAVDKS